MNAQQMPEGAQGHDPAAHNAGRRRTLLIGAAGVILIVGLAYAVWHFFFAGHSESTEDAYTAVEVTQITPLVSGPVRTVAVVDTQAVKAGDTLVVLDDTDAELAYRQAQASLVHAQAQVHQLVATDVSLGGQENLRDAETRSAQADLAKAAANLEKANLDAKRRRNLVAGGAVSQQELTDAETRLREAQATYDQTQSRISVAMAARTQAGGQRQANAALIGDKTVDTNPEVLVAAARLEQMRINRDRTVIRAPVDGIVTQRVVDAGQQVQAGSRLMSIVPVNQIYVDANFKEGQLQKVRPGMAVKVTSDLYGEDVVYTGHVDGIAGGTGAAFSAIPAQNATGNWIKVVQRLPVRVKLDPAQLSKHPLRVGLSMKAVIDLDSGKQE